jgi:hypothetical protein
MKAETSSHLVEEFANDHRRLTRGLAELLSTIRRGDLEAAVAIGDRIDRQAGGHIQFEESVLYPAVGKAQGRAYEEKLLSEHEVARRGLMRLAGLRDDELHDARVKAELIDAFSTAEQHAESCGTLISHLELLPVEEQKTALAQLQQCRREAPRWTQLHSDT